MTEKAKDRVINLSGSLIASIIVVLVGFSLSANREDDKDLIYKIDSKVDKTEYKEKCIQIQGQIDNANMRMDDMEKKQAEYLQTLNDIKNIVTETKTDVKWIDIWRKEQSENKKNKD